MMTAAIMLLGLAAAAPLACWLVMYLRRRMMARRMIRRLMEWT